jgi:hypothetical protein
LVKELDKDGAAQIILPLTEYSCSWENTETPVYGKYPLFLASKVTLKQYFPVEPGFAIAVHKVEGRTLARVIIALSGCEVQRCNFSYAQLHIAFS